MGDSASETGGSRIGFGLLFVAVFLALGAAIAMARIYPVDDKPANSESSSFSTTECSDTWDALSPDIRSQVGSRESFIRFCGSTNFKSFMCTIDPVADYCAGNATDARLPSVGAATLCPRKLDAKVDDAELIPNGDPNSWIAHATGHVVNPSRETVRLSELFVSWVFKSDRNLSRKRDAEVAYADFDLRNPPVLPPGETYAFTIDHVFSAPGVTGPVVAEPDMLMWFWPDTVDEVCDSSREWNE